MADLLYHVFAFVALLSYGLYHLVSAIRAHCAGSSSPTASARPYYPPALLSHRHNLLRHLPLYLAILSLLVAAAAHVLFSADEALTSDLRISSVESAAVLLFFALLASSLLFLPLPADLLFLLASLSFALLSAASAHSAAAHEKSELQAKCDAISSLVSAASAATALVLAITRLFLAELALATTIALQGLWSLQTGLSLYVEAFIPEGCYRLQASGDISLTRCELDESRHRAFALLDLAFTIHAILISIFTLIVYASNAGSSGADGHSRRHNGGSYEALPASSSACSGMENHHIQMKALSKSSTQA